MDEQKLLERYRLQCLAVRMLGQASTDMAAELKDPGEVGISKQERYLRNQAAADKADAERWLNSKDDTAPGFNFILCVEMVGECLGLKDMPLPEMADRVRRAVMMAPDRMAQSLNNLHWNMVDDTLRTRRPSHEKGMEPTPARRA
ncbi:hypothetical protein [Vogesella sp. XCS3]|uniref:hypothetical protein n=1 Tax=Vogesella sp. XCS3 TaxID=2877939 RepID=UPI001D09ECE2|nr:hypothetical protein [Vogesella sp. XCS3]UDM18918.1 hypothetical protein LCH97_17900 [Vogesella sp. XCS3]